MSRIFAESVPDLMVSALNKKSQIKNGNVCEVTWSGFFGEQAVRCAFTINAVESYMIVSYDAEGKFYRYSVKLRETTPFFGGKRYWFLCPLNCNRRVGVLYLVNGHFGCRYCHGVVYRSQYITHTGRFRTLYLAGRYLGLSLRIDELRTKWFRGQPTKRHQRYVEKQHKINAILDDFQD